jgi:hypothetical protein
MLRLPFEAPGFMQYVSHAGLEHAAANDASFMFINALAMMGIRPVGWLVRWLVGRIGQSGCVFATFFPSFFFVFFFLFVVV